MMGPRRVAAGEQQGASGVRAGRQGMGRQVGRRRPPRAFIAPAFWKLLPQMSQTLRVATLSTAREACQRSVPGASPDPELVME